MSMLLGHQSLYPSRTSLLLPKPSFYGHSHATFRVRSRSSFAKTIRNGPVGYKPSNIKAIATGSPEQHSKLKATVSVQEQSDDGADLFRKTLSLELVFSEHDSKTKEERFLKARVVQKVGDDLKATVIPKEPSSKAQVVRKVEKVLYEAEFDEVSSDYGEVGAVYVTNEDDNKIFVETIALEGFPYGQVILTCNSWVEIKQKRLFFTNKSTYLPSQTPSGLRRLRKEELVSLRGDGKGERKQGDRIYDYDVYNDLDYPDTSPNTRHLDDPDTNRNARPVLGGKDHPYPRRCRTGRKRSQNDPSKETRSDYMYVPQDEEFSDTKQKSFDGKQATETVRSVKAALDAGNITDATFSHIAAIDELFIRIDLPTSQKLSWFDTLKQWIGQAIKVLLKFETPEVMSSEKEKHYLKLLLLSLSTIFIDSFANVITNVSLRPPQSC